VQGDRPDMDGRSTARYRSEDIVLPVIFDIVEGGFPAAVANRHLVHGHVEEAVQVDVCAEFASHAGSRLEGVDLTGRTHSLGGEKRILPDIGAHIEHRHPWREQLQEKRNRFGLKKAIANDAHFDIGQLLDTQEYITPKAPNEEAVGHLYERPFAALD